jgi:hypothetical protein
VSFVYPSLTRRFTYLRQDSDEEGSASNYFPARASIAVVCLLNIKLITQALKHFMPNK